jgi:SAM-dependent methyltransferase
MLGHRLAGPSPDIARGRRAAMPRAIGEDSMAAFAFLDHPFLWRMSRFGLNLALGLYRKRYQTMRRWQVLAEDPSVLDIGCGIGQYATVTNGDYLGLDLNSRYVRYAQRRYRGDNKAFQCQDATLLLDCGAQFDVVLLVDFLHHVPDDASVNILKNGRRLARQYVVSFEPVLEQTNPAGRWIIAHDRGDYIRPLAALHGLFRAADLAITASLHLPLGVISTRAILCDVRSRGAQPAIAA